MELGILRKNADRSAAVSFNPNANANTFTPGAGTPPFRPGQPYQPAPNPYAQQQSDPNQQNQQQGQYQQYDQYQQYQGGSNQYGQSTATRI